MLVQQFRRELATILASKAPDAIVAYCQRSASERRLSDHSPSSATATLRYYDILSRGSLKQLSEVVPECSLEQMQRVLASSQAVDLSYLEFISLFLNKNIFLLSKAHQDVYSTGDRELLERPERQCIVLMADGSHYELVGIHNKAAGLVQTVFHYSDELIVAIRQRLDQLTNNNRQAGQQEQHREKQEQPSESQLQAQSMPTSETVSYDRNQSELSD